MKTGRIVVLGIVLFFISFNFWQYRQLDNFQEREESIYGESFKVMGGDLYQWQVKPVTPFTIINLSKLLKYPENLLLEEGALIFEIPFRVTPRKLFKISDEDVIDFPHELIGGNMVDRFFAKRHFKATSLLTADGKSPHPEDYAKEFFDRRGFLTDIIWWGRIAWLATIQLGILGMTLLMFFSLRHAEFKKLEKRELIEKVVSCLTALPLKQFLDKENSLSENDKLILIRILEIEKALIEYERDTISSYKFRKKLIHYSLENIVVDVQCALNTIAQREMLQRGSQQRLQQHRQDLEKGKEDLESLFARHMALWAYKDNNEHGRMYRAVGAALDGIRDDLDRKKISLKGFNFVKENLVLLENVKKGVKK